MKYLYTLLALISCHLGAMELPNTDTQWADTPAKNVMARFSKEKRVLFDGKEYSATAIQHAYLELLRETSGKDSQFMWNDEEENNGIRLFKLMHYMTQHYDLQVLLGFGSDSNLLLYGKNYERTWSIVDANMLSTMETMGVDTTGFKPEPEINNNNNQPALHVAPAPQEPSFFQRWWSHLGRAYASLGAQSYVTPRNTAITMVAVGGAATAYYVAPHAIVAYKTMLATGKALLALPAKVALIIEALRQIDEPHERARRNRLHGLLNDLEGQQEQCAIL